ncbi:MAG: hypothetical protein ABW212_07850, partial [Pseudonocardia sediminis]
MVGDLIRLTFAVRRHTPSWKRWAGFGLGVAAAAATWAATLLADAPVRADVLGLLLAVWLAGWVVGPILAPAAAVLRPEYFTVLPLDRRRLGAGLLASAFVGVGAVVTAAALLALVGYAAVGGGPVAASVAVALTSAVLLLVLVVALARTAYALLGAAMRTRVGVEIAAIQYGFLISTMLAGWFVVYPVVSVVPVFLRDGLPGAASSVVSWLPTAWPIRAVDAVAAGDLTTALAWLATLAVAAGVATAAATALLTPHVGARTARRRSRPIGSRALTGTRVLPATPTGAVLGKELRAWWRDPWRSLEVRTAVWFGIFVAVWGAVLGVPEVGAAAGIAVALMAALSGSNLYGQDGTALWLLVAGQSPEAVRADVRGRRLGLVLAMGPAAFALSAVLVALTGAWVLAAGVAAVIAATLGAGSGVAVLMSVLGATPGVDPHRRVNATDAGENPFALQVSFWATLLL